MLVGISGKTRQDNQLKKQMDPDVYELRKRLARYGRGPETTAVGGLFVLYQPVNTLDAPVS